MINTTLKKLSEVSGLSISTISRALKNHPDISEKTKLLVTELASTLDYEPNINAVHLRTKNSRLFGVIVPSISNFFYDSVIASLEEEGRKNNYSLMILQSGDDPEIEAANIKLCRQNRVNGLFACITPETKDIEPFLKLKEVDVSVIFFDRVPERSDCHKVCVADIDSASMAANLIVEKQKKKVLALFGNSNFLITKKRFNAFTEIMNQHSIAYITAYSSSEIHAEELTNECLTLKPDTIFCMTDEILTGVMRAIQKKQLKIPDDIAVIAISNGFIPTLYYPQITYIETSGKKLGKLAFQSMMATLSGSTFIQDRTIESILVKGGSI
ncbi:MAG: LacI family DNA-binding transcriptional regulator [Chitinophagaceae bacterium]|nr:LacI family DNA-binding transcriptional regulator [Chitinophagaceae bacterium]